MGLLFWESATECQTSQGSTKDNTQGTMQTFTSLIPFTKELGIMLPSHKHYSREGARKHDAKAKPYPSSKGTIMCEQHKRTPETCRERDTERKRQGERDRKIHTSALWHHLHHLIGKEQLWIWPQTLKSIYSSINSILSTLQTGSQKQEVLLK